MDFVKRLNILRHYLVKYNSTPVKMKIDKMAPIIPCSNKLSTIKAAQCLQNGEVIAIPTDTIYGLACSANCPDAIKKLYAIKGRDSEKPVAICVTNIEDIRKWCESAHLSDELIKCLLPGPVTIVLEKSSLLDNPYLNPKTSKIGIRIPNHNFVNQVTKVFDKPMALTSANLSNEPSTLSIKEFEHLYSHLGAVFDGGHLSRMNQNRAGSTVVDLAKAGTYKIIRCGISYENIVGILETHGFKCRL